MLPGILAPADADLFNPPERNILLQNGLSTFVTLGDGTVAIERVITENRTDTNSVQNISQGNSMAKPSRLRFPR